MLSYRPVEDMKHQRQRSLVVLQSLHEATDRFFLLCLTDTISDPHVICLQGVQELLKLKECKDAFTDDRNYLFDLQ